MITAQSRCDKPEPGIFLSLPRTVLCIQHLINIYRRWRSSNEGWTNTPVVWWGPASCVFNLLKVGHANSQRITFGQFDLPSKSKTASILRILLDWDLCWTIPASQQFPKWSMSLKTHTNKQREWGMWLRREGWGQPIETGNYIHKRERAGLEKCMRGRTGDGCLLVFSLLALPRVVLGYNKHCYCTELNELIWLLPYSLNFNLKWAIDTLSEAKGWAHKPLVQDEMS